MFQVIYGIEKRGGYDVFETIQAYFEQRPAWQTAAWT